MYKRQAEGLRRVDALPSYEGRPVAVGSDGVAAVNYLLMTTSQDGSLESVLIAHLSASRRHLTLIALPADLIADDGSGRLTLATSYRLDPLRTARAVESLTETRMDHQVPVSYTHLDVYKRQTMPAGRPRRDCWSGLNRSTTPAAS